MNGVEISSTTEENLGASTTASSLTYSTIISEITSKASVSVESTKNTTAGATSVIPDEANTSSALSSTENPETVTVFLNQSSTTKNPEFDNLAKVADIIEAQTPLKTEETLDTVKTIETTTATVTPVILKEANTASSVSSSENISPAAAENVESTTILNEQSSTPENPASDVLEKVAAINKAEMSSTTQKISDEVSTAPSNIPTTTVPDTESTTFKATENATPVILAEATTVTSDDATGATEKVSEIQSSTANTITEYTSTGNVVVQTTFIPASIEESQHDISATAVNLVTEKGNDATISAPAEITESVVPLVAVSEDESLLTSKKTSVTLEATTVAPHISETTVISELVTTEIPSVTKMSTEESATMITKNAATVPQMDVTAETVSTTFAKETIITSQTSDSMPAAETSTLKALSTAATLGIEDTTVVAVSDNEEGIRKPTTSEYVIETTIKTESATTGIPQTTTQAIKTAATVEFELTATVPVIISENEEGVRKSSIAVGEATIDIYCC
uniref:Uncharacterized protein n=1 Tax=Panagrolaimus davidi TaxID=227884 RepID=A0A914PJW0_9BILA